MKDFGEFFRQSFRDLIAYVLGMPREGAPVGHYLFAVGVILFALAGLVLLCQLIAAHHTLPLPPEEREESGESDENDTEPPSEKAQQAGESLTDGKNTEDSTRGGAD